jgi:hypothetical protein
VDFPEEKKFDNSKELDDVSDEFVIEESEDEGIEEEIDNKETKTKSEKDKEIHVPFSFEKPVEKPKNPLADSEEKKESIIDKKEQKSPSPFSFDKTVEQPKKDFVEIKRNSNIFNKNENKTSDTFSLDQKEEKINLKEEEIDLGKLNKDHGNKKSLDIIEQGRREAQRGIQKESPLKSQPPIDTTVKKDGIFQLNDQINIDLDKKSISVICPKCKHIFSAKKTGNVSSIKCPVCGKEGIIK